jgi:hypothetical protein
MAALKMVFSSAFCNTICVLSVVCVQAARNRRIPASHAFLVLINRLSPLSDDFVILAYLQSPWQISPTFHIENSHIKGLTRHYTHSSLSIFRLKTHYL